MKRLLFVCALLSSFLPADIAAFSVPGTQGQRAGAVAAMLCFVGDRIVSYNINQLEDDLESLYRRHTAAERLFRARMQKGEREPFALKMLREEIEEKEDSLARYEDLQMGARAGIMGSVLTVIGLALRGDDAKGEEQAESVPSVPLDIPGVPDGPESGVGDDGILEEPRDESRTIEHDTRVAVKELSSVKDKDELSAFLKQKTLSEKLNKKRREMTDEEKNEVLLQNRFNALYTKAVDVSDGPWLDALIQQYPQGFYVVSGESLLTREQYLSFTLDLVFWISGKRWTKEQKDFWNKLLDAMGSEPFASEDQIKTVLEAKTGALLNSSNSVVSLEALNEVVTKLREKKILKRSRDFYELFKDDFEGLRPIAEVIKAENENPLRSSGEAAYQSRQERRSNASRGPNYSQLTFAVKRKGDLLKRKKRK